MTDSARAVGKSVTQLLLVGVLMVVGYICIDRVRFTVGILNSIFACAVYLIPFLALWPVLRLPRLPKVCALILLVPLLLLSSLLLMGRALFMRERTESLQIVQQGHSTIELQRYENGGAVGLRGLNLEQRRLILPGLYIVRPIDFFDYAKQGTLSVEGTNRVRAHVKGNYDNNEAVVDKAYDLKPWVFF